MRSVPIEKKSVICPPLNAVLNDSIEPNRETGNPVPVIKEVATNLAPIMSGVANLDTTPFNAGSVSSTCPLLKFPAEIVLHIGELLVGTSKDQAGIVSFEPERNLSRFGASCKLFYETANLVLNTREQENLARRTAEYAIDHIVMTPGLRMEEISDRIKTLCDSRRTIALQISCLRPAHWRAALCGVFESKHWEALTVKAHFTLWDSSEREAFLESLLIKMNLVRSPDSALASVSLDMGRSYGAKNLESALRQGLNLKNPSIFSLLLSENFISSTCAVALAESLKHNATLRILDLSNNQIGDDGAEAIARALIGNTALHELMLNDNPITAYGMSAFAEMLLSNTTLQKLALSCTGSDPASLKALGDALAENTTLAQLEIRLTEIGDDGVTALVRELGDKASLVSLSLQGFQLTFAGGVSLGDMLARNVNLTSLSLKYYHISADGMAEIVRGLGANHTLGSIRLQHAHLSTRLEHALCIALRGRAAPLILEIDLNSPSLPELPELNALCNGKPYIRIRFHRDI